MGDYSDAFDAQRASSGADDHSGRGTLAIVLDRRPVSPGTRNYVPVMIIALTAILVLPRHLVGLISNV